MSIEIPGPVMDLMQLYGLPWPDVNEDAFHQLQTPLKQFGADAISVADAIDSALGELEASNHSQTLVAIRNHVSAIRQQYLEPINDICVELAGTPCNLAYDAIHDLKIALLGILTGEVCTDVIDAVASVFTLGLSDAEAAAEMLAVSEEVQTMLDFAATTLSGQLISMGEGYIDTFVNSIVNPFVQNVANAIDSEVNSYSPELALAIAAIATQFGDGQNGGGGAPGILHDAGQVEQAVSQIVESAASLEQAIGALVSAVEAIFSEPDPQTFCLPSASTILREVLKGVLQNISTDLINAVKALVQAMIDHFIQLLQDWISVLGEMDAMLASLARKEQLAKTAGLEIGAVTDGMVVDVVAGVAAVSGLTDDEAAGVGVGEAEAAVFMATATGKVTGVAAVDADATAVDQTVERLVPKDDVAKVMVQAAKAFDQAVDRLEVKTDAKTPAAGGVSSAATVQQTLNPKVSTETPHLASAGSPSASAEVRHGAATRDEPHEPKTGTAEPTGQGVDNLAKTDDHGASVVIDEAQAVPVTSE